MNEAINVKVTDLNQQARLEALARYLDVPMEDIMPEGDREFSHGGEYLVLTDEEADIRAREYILESIWAFKPSFIIDHANTGSLTSRQFDALESAIKLIQEKLCEDANPIIMAMVNERIDHFIDDAIAADGRGHFMSSYDGEEGEEGEFFIYRTN